MLEPEFTSEFSQGATWMLNSIAATAPKYQVASEVGEHSLLRYAAGVLPQDEAARVEAVAVSDPAVRRRLVEHLSLIGRLQDVPYAHLIREPAESGMHPSDLAEWIAIVDRHVEVVTECLRGSPPTTWPALAELSRQGSDGVVAARTIWRALFASPNTEIGRAPLQLGFGFRRGAQCAVEPVQLFTQLEGRVRANGDLEILASTELGPRETAVFFAFSMNGRALPLAEAAIKNGRVTVVVEGLGEFLNLPTGPIPDNTLAARLDDWPLSCHLGNVVVHSGSDVLPTLTTPIVREGSLMVTAAFENPQLEGDWDLLVAVTPNSWQKLAQFDIKCVIERPQVLMAEMPKTAKEGPFGGALWLRRRDSSPR